MLMFWKVCGGEEEMKRSGRPWKLSTQAMREWSFVVCVDGRQSLL
jgi:hypothetical protein